MPAPAEPQRLDILGVGVDRYDEEAVLRRISSLLDGDGCKQVVTLNPEYVMRAGRDPELRWIINAAELAVPDGMGIVWASRLLGEPLPGRITGTDLLPRICDVCAEKRMPVFLLGGRHGVAEETAARLQRRRPDLEVAGTSDRDPDPALDDAIVGEINRSGARLLAVAYGCPKQDFWIDRNRRRLQHVRVAIGVGGAFDFISGQVPRAPRAMRRAGLEWLFRLWLEPHRARRMVALPRFGLAVLLSRARARRRR